MERDALYYPNIQIPSADWLKRALLVFPHVARIVPENFSPNDSKEIWDFENVLGRRGEPLLKRAHLLSGGVWEAQRKLIGWLERDISRDESFIRRFDKRSASRFERKFDESSFHLHPGKMTGSLIRLLEEHELAWATTGDRRSRGFVRVHPLLGELVMSTLAIACARDEGFNIVAQDGRLHRCLANHDALGAYKEFTQPKSKAAGKASVADGGKIFEIIVFQKCNVSSLTPESIGDLSEDREAVEDLKVALEGIAKLVPEMRDEDRFQERIKSNVDDALQRWRSDRANMSAFARQVFGSEAVKPTGDIFKNAFEKGLPALAAGAGTAAVLSGPSILGWAAGAVVGLVVHAASSWASVKKKERDSPFRYLTQLEKAGVVFAVSA